MKEDPDFLCDSVVSIYSILQTHNPYAYNFFFLEFVNGRMSSVRENA